MASAFRTCLLASVAAGLAACATPSAPAPIDYRSAAPGGRQAPQRTVMEEPRPVLPAAPPPAPGAPAARAPEPAPYQIVADLGPSTGVPAVAEAKSIPAQTGARPGGPLRQPRDMPANRGVEVQRGDTLYDISRRYSVNMRALIETNALEPPYALDVGATVFLPPPNVHVVEAGETLYSVSRRYNVDTRSLALLNGMQRPWTVWPGDELLLPPLARDQQRAAPKPQALASAPPPAPARPAASRPGAPDKPIQLASPKPVAAQPAPPRAEPKSAPRSEPKTQPKTEPKPPVAAAVAPPPKASPAPSAARDFIWPVTGRVLKGYGTGADGVRNDGINIAALKGSEIRAAAGGEVVYAGNELAGFGNLILIRHPGGWVTAYAHADSMLVKEGELVKQGQAIGAGGSTGNAASPQLHFELRKGKEPVDPTQHLPALNS